MDSGLGGPILVWDASTACGVRSWGSNFQSASTALISSSSLSLPLRHRLHLSFRHRLPAASKLMGSVARVRGFQPGSAPVLAGFQILSPSHDFLLQIRSPRSQQFSPSCLTGVLGAADSAFVLEAQRPRCSGSNWCSWSSGFGVLGATGVLGAADSAFVLQIKRIRCSGSNWCSCLTSSSRSDMQQWFRRRPFIRLDVLPASVPQLFCLDGSWSPVLFTSLGCFAGDLWSLWSLCLCLYSCLLILCLLYGLLLAFFLLVLAPLISRLDLTSLVLSDGSLTGLVSKSLKACSVFDPLVSRVDFPVLYLLALFSVVRCLQPVVRLCLSLPFWQWFFTQPLWGPGSLYVMFLLFV